MAKKPRSAAWHLYLTAVVLCCAVGYALYAQWRALPHEEPPPEPVVAEELPPAPASSARQFADAFYEEVDRALEARGLWPALPLIGLAVAIGMHRLRALEIQL